MIINDIHVRNILKKVRSFELEDMLDSYPEDERFGRTDLEMLQNELDYLVECLESDGCASHEALMEAKTILYRTSYGKVMPLWESTLQPMYSRTDIQEAKNLVNEYHRLKRLQKKLQED